MRQPGNFKQRLLAALPILAVASTSFCLLPGRVSAQACTTQAKMTPLQRSEIGSAAYGLASAIQAGDVARVHAASVSNYSGDPNQTAFLIRATGQHLAGDALAVSQTYLLDASSRSAGDTSEAEFTCSLSGSTNETDFGIAGLPPGRYAFAMVEARGSDPWLLAFLLQQEGSSWKMAGFYPHTRSAAGHDGLWYWTTARNDVKANKPWLAYLLYGEANQLLRPASFVSSGNLDKLSSEQRSAAPQGIADGISSQTPLSLQGAGGAVYQITELRPQVSDDGKTLNLWLRLHYDAPVPSDTATARNLEAAQALLATHPEIREAFANVWVVAEGTGMTPVTTQRSTQQAAAVKE